MSITIIVPNSRDLRVERLIESIDYFGDGFNKIELLTVLNYPTDELFQLYKDLEKNMQAK